MILNIAQERRNKTIKWLITRENSTAHIHSIAINHGRFFTIDTFYDDNTSHSITYYPDNIGGSHKKEFEIWDKDLRVGSIRPRIEKIGAWRKCIYYECEYEGYIFRCYEVRVGTSGTFLCIYEGNTPISIIDKTVNNNKNLYTAYILDDKYAKPTVYFNIYYDSVTQSALKKGKLYSEVSKPMYANTKEQCAKYDKGFIDLIKRKEESIV